MATQPIAPPMTVDEFIRVYTDDDRVELIDGEVCEREVSGFTHFTVQNNIKDLFEEAGIKKRGYRCFVEATSRLSRRTAVTPDVSVIRFARIQGLTDNAPVEGAPDIAFEVSITDKASVLERKRVAYRANGAQAVCFVFPDSRSIHVYDAGGWHYLTTDDSLEFTDLLPGLAIPVAAIFAELEPLPHNQ